MPDYAFATDFFGFAQIRDGYVAWPRGDAEAQVIAQLSPGDRIIPKFAQSPTTGTTAAAIEAREQVQRMYAEEAGLADSYETLLEEYAAKIKGGDAAVPLMLTVTGGLPDATALGKPWARAAIEVTALDHPFSAQEFLRLRPVPEELTRQLKGMVAPGRHLQALPQGTVDALVAAAGTADRESVLRRYSLVSRDIIVMLRRRARTRG